MNATEQIAAFIADVESRTDKFTESRSSLKNLLAYLRVAANQNRRFSSVQDAISKCANPNDFRLDKYRPAINALVAVWGTRGNYQRGAVAAPPVVASGTSSKAMTLVNEVKGQLEACQKYICNDVGTFPQCVNKQISSSEQNRIRSAKPVPVGMPILGDGSWNGKALEQSYSSVVSKRAGECTNYAYYAGYILSQGKTTPKPRLEIISWEGKGMAKHCFVIVGRTGGTTNGALPPVKDWNDDCVIVDCWALSLGHQCVYNKVNYCFPGMMHPSKVLMDSTKVKSAAPMNVQGGLRATPKVVNGKKLW